MNLIKKKWKQILKFCFYRWKQVFKTNTELWNGVKNKIETINVGKEGEYKKDFTKSKFGSDSNLLLNRRLKFHTLTIVAWSVEVGKYSRQFF